MERFTSFEETDRLFEETRSRFRRPSEFLTGREWPEPHSPAARAGAP